MKTRIRAIVGGLAVLATFAVGTPAQAQEGSEPAAALGTQENPFMIAAGTACGSSCDGKDPSTYAVYVNGRITTCSADAITPKLSSGYVYRASDPVGSVELRYSPACRTAWARTTSSDESFKVVSRYLSGTHRTTMTGASPATWTVMVNDADLEAQACYWPNGPYTGWTCTRWW